MRLIEISLFADLEEKTVAIAHQLGALAAKTGMADLAAQVEMTNSSLDRMQDSDLEQSAERIVFLANNNIGALADYGITAADVTALGTARTAFQENKTLPRETAAQRKALTGSLPQLIANLRSIFRNEIDKMMTPFQKTNADFYNGYFAARVIVDRDATHASGAAPTPVTAAAAGVNPRRCRGTEFTIYLPGVRPSKADTHESPPKLNSVIAAR